MLGCVAVLMIFLRVEEEEFSMQRHGTPLLRAHVQRLASGPAEVLHARMLAADGGAGGGAGTAAVGSAHDAAVAPLLDGATLGYVMFAAIVFVLGAVRFARAVFLGGGGGRLWRRLRRRGPATRLVESTV